MKFGKSISARAQELPGLYHMDYKLLKRRIKDVVDSADPAARVDLNCQFERQLRKELDGVAMCFRTVVAGVFVTLQEIGEAVEGATAGGDTWRGCMERAVQASREIDQLRHYAVWNAVGVVKILKKRRKNVPELREADPGESAAWLHQEVFFSGEEFGALQAALESIGDRILLRCGEVKGQRKMSGLSEAAEPCTICMGPVVDAVKLCCGHQFCWRCFVLGPIEGAVGGYRLERCPTCRSEQPLVPENYLGDARLPRFLRHYMGESAPEYHEENDPYAAAVQQLLAVASSPDQTASLSSGFFSDPASQSSTLPAPPADHTEEKQQSLQQWMQQSSSAWCGTLFCFQCSEPLELETVVEAPCGHQFHGVCLRRVQDRGCPVCGEELPWQWFMDPSHPLASTGFALCRPEDQPHQHPALPGLPCGTCGGYPLRRPPPAVLHGQGLTLRSYVHLAPVEASAAPPAAAKGGPPAAPAEGAPGGRSTNATTPGSTPSTSRSSSCSRSADPQAQDRWCAAPEGVMVWFES
mmetsp:Transcript_119054/g.273006  ORF Transcript_119054/g.273006 Transcript_119054/m.273006 type:complete len:524 (+) Transcript_119054:40-1611(+)